MQERREASIGGVLEFRSLQQQFEKGKSEEQETWRYLDLKYYRVRRLGHAAFSKGRIGTEHIKEGKRRRQRLRSGRHP